MKRALNITDRAKFADQLLPGSFWLDDEQPDGTVLFWYVCPCGCGHMAPLLVGNGFKPTSTDATWEWNGSRTEPTLKPSVNHVGHWHGWLRDGYWEQVG